MPVIITFQLIGHSAAKLEYTMSKGLPAWRVIYGQPRGLLPLHPLQNYALIYASWLLSFIFLCVPLARMGKETSSIWKHFYTLRFFRVRVGWEGGSIICSCVSEEICISEWGWLGQVPRGKSLLQKKKIQFCPQFSICEISTSQSVQHLPRHKSQTTPGLDYHCGLL